MLIRIKLFRFVLNIFTACGTHKTIFYQPSDAQLITYVILYRITYGAWVVWVEIQLQNKCAIHKRLN